MYVVYLDEFGHIGPFAGRGSQRFSESPVFGLAGLILPANQVRSFSSWFYQRKCQLLDFEIKRDGRHPATWEKKGSALYTIKNIEKYRELRAFTNRFLNRVGDCGGHVIYVGLHKQADAREHKPLRLYSASLRKRLRDSTHSVKMTLQSRTSWSSWISTRSASRSSLKPAAQCSAN